MYRYLLLLLDPADFSLILDIVIYIKDGKIEDQDHGSHSRIKETSHPLNVSGILAEEFNTRRGQIIVSRKNPQSYHTCLVAKI